MESEGVDAEAVLAGYASWLKRQPPAARSREAEIGVSSERPRLRPDNPSSSTRSVGQGNDRPHRNLDRNGHLERASFELSGGRH